MEEAIEKLLDELKDAPAAPLDRDSARGRITAAALELFAERSYESATTKAIAQRAGVTERTLFKHFPSKETLFAKTVFPALLEVLQPVALRGFKQVLAAHHGDFEATLTALVTERLAFARQHPGLVTMLARELLMRPPFRLAIAAFFDAQVRPQLFEIFATARAAGQLRDVPDDLVMRTIIGQVAATVATRLLLTPEAPLDDEAEVRRIVETVMRGVGGKG